MREEEQSRTQGEQTMVLETVLPRIPVKLAACNDQLVVYYTAHFPNGLAATAEAHAMEMRMAIFMFEASITE